MEEIPVMRRITDAYSEGIPVFAGASGKTADDQNGSLLNRCIRITSFTQYRDLFGENSDPLSLTSGQSRQMPVFQLSHAAEQYFLNGGDACYILSTGDYAQTGADFRTDKILNALDQAEIPEDVILISVPDMSAFPATDYRRISEALMKRCSKHDTAMALIDLHEGWKQFDGQELAGKRELLGTGEFKNAAVYYPWLQSVTYGPRGKKRVKHFLPPCGAVAAVWRRTDRSRGIWKAPAGTDAAIVWTLEPMVSLNDQLQAGFNVSADGKSVNAIRNFEGLGTLVWGARTLAGNDNEWRYIPVRRLIRFLNASVRAGLDFSVFEPNDVRTWTQVTGMTENYLHGYWRNGALAGSKPEHAFFVKCGLGTTMTQQDILTGRLNVEIGVAPVRPAEFIIFKLSLKMMENK